MITVQRAPAWLVVQDLGWGSHRAMGMPTGGAMDRHALSVANLLVGNKADAAGLEWALGGGTIRFERPATIALTGARLEATLAGEPVSMNTSHRAQSGDELVVTRFVSGVFAYVAVQGGMGVDPILGSRSTYVRGGFGGLHGRRLRAEDFLPLGQSTSAPPPEGFAAPDELVVLGGDRPIRVTPGPQAVLFDAEATERLADAEWIIAAASDRMGYRLKGPEIGTIAAGLTRLGAGVSGGSPGPRCGRTDRVDGRWADRRRVPKLAVVCGADLGRLAQTEPGRSIRFSWISMEEAQRLHRRRAVQLHTLTALINGALAP